jgi:DNA-directed RNA polymerase specialized sigma24 family protein
MEDGEERPVEHERGSDEQRFITLYAETADAIHRYALRRLPLGSHDAPDLTAEILAVAWRRISSVPDPPHDRLWLFRLLQQPRGGQRIPLLKVPRLP